VLLFGALVRLVELERLKLLVQSLLFVVRVVGVVEVELTVGKTDFEKAVFVKFGEKEEGHSKIEVNIFSSESH
jgi:hypothetical protein